LSSAGGGGLSCGGSSQKSNGQKELHLEGCVGFRNFEEKWIWVMCVGIIYYRTSGFQLVFNERTQILGRIAANSECEAWGKKKGKMKWGERTAD